MQNAKEHAQREIATVFRSTGEPTAILNNLRRCSRCALPETHETILFDEEGVCNVCRQHEYKQSQIDWTAREQELSALIDQYRGKHDYDCIVPFSGGKDSTFTLYELVHRFKVKPLVVTFDHGFLRPTTLENTDRTIRLLGVDYLKFRPSWKVVRKLMQESLRRKGDFCWHCHTGIFSYPMHVAVKFKVPLVIWGEPSSEYTSYYGYDEDCIHWHQQALDACRPFGASLYPELKQACDSYFFLPHRNEPRGIGGIFFDDWTRDGFERSVAFVKSVGDHFLPAYVPIFERRMQTPSGEPERRFQLYRRGRYAEFNLAIDRGTRYGLQSGRRVESVLASLPPLAAWQYDFRPDPGTPEADLYERFLPPKWWVGAPHVVDKSGD